MASSRVGEIDGVLIDAEPAGDLGAVTQDLGRRDTIPNLAADQHRRTNLLLEIRSIEPIVIVVGQQVKTGTGT